MSETFVNHIAMRFKHKLISFNGTAVKLISNNLNLNLYYANKV